MPRAARLAPGGLIYHVLNRGVGRATLFDTPQRALAPSLQVPLCPASPIERDAGWVEWVNGLPPPQEDDAIRHCLHQGRPFGSDAWLSRTMRQIGWREPGKPGRPRARRATSVTM